MSESTASGTPTKSAVVRRRAFAFVAIAILLQVSPFAEQVLHLPRRPLFMGWRMFATTGVGICQVRYEVSSAVGNVPLPLSVVAPGAKKFRNVEEALALGRKHCASLPVGTALRTYVKCGHKHAGWVTKADGEEDLCAAIP